MHEIIGKFTHKTLINEIKPPGYYEVEFEGGNFPSGIYYYRLVVSLSNPIESGNFSLVRKMMLVK